MAGFSDRPAVRRRIVEVVADALGPGVQVSYAYPAEAAVSADAVWFGSVDGAQSVETFGGDRSGRDDRWTLKAVVASAGHLCEEDADAACQVSVSAVCDVLFGGGRLGPDWMAVAVYPGALDGPNAARSGPTEPVFAVAELTIEIVAPIRGC